MKPLNGQSQRAEARIGRSVIILALLYLVSLPVLAGTVERMGHVFAQTPFEDVTNRRYLENPVVSALHLLPGFLMLLVAPLQFSNVLRGRFPAVHRFCGNVFVVTGILSGVGVLWMVIGFPALGGLLTQVVTFVLVGGMFVSMWIGVQTARARAFRKHSAFMIRAYAVALSVSTARVSIKAGEYLLGLSFEQTFVAASAIGVIVNVLFAEWLIWRVRIV